MELIKRRMVEMDLGLKGKKALITGSASGIGKAITIITRCRRSRGYY
jgi:hypothetical protein